MPIFRHKGPFNNLKLIRIVYKLDPKLDTPFVQTFFDGILSAKAQKDLKSPSPINPKTKKPYDPKDLYNLHVRQIVRILAKHKKDGGGISETKSERVWVGEFEVKDRQPRHVG